MPASQPGVFGSVKEPHLIFPCCRIGAVYGSRYSIWDLSNLQGGKPSISGPGFVEGGHQFR